MTTRHQIAAHQQSLRHASTILSPARLATLKASGKRLGDSNSKYDPKYDREIIAHFESYIDAIKNKDATELRKKVLDFPMFSDFAAKIGISDEDLELWKKKYPSFLLAYSRALQLYRKYIVMTGSSAVSNPIFTMFVSKNVAGFRDSVDMVLPGSKPMPVFIAADNKRARPRNKK
jgi:hypothetical protein